MWRLHGTFNAGIPGSDRISPCGGIIWDFSVKICAHCCEDVSEEVRDLNEAAEDWDDVELDENDWEE
jgi:hypothetical protein